MLYERSLVVGIVHGHVWATLCLLLGLERLIYMPIRPALPMHASILEVYELGILAVESGVAHLAVLL